MDQALLLSTVAEILEIDVSDVSMESSLDELDWDSLSRISFIAAVDQFNGKTVSPDALKACTTVADLQPLT